MFVYFLRLPGFLAQAPHTPAIAYFLCCPVYDIFLLFALNSTVIFRQTEILTFC